MEPRSPEHLPTPIEYSPQTNTEVGGELVSNQPERREAAPLNEKVGEQQRPVTTTQSPVVQLPTPVVVQSDDGISAQDDSGHPAVAGDDDLIEKEWVDKAKQIISQTKDDPYKREQAVGRLQADYLQKRYGKALGKEAS